MDAPDVAAPNPRSRPAVDRRTVVTVFVAVVVATLLLAWLRHLHGNLWGPLALHMTLNTLISAAGLTALN